MSPEERERMHALCARIEIEKDHDKFTKLVQELNDLLESKENRLGNTPSGTGSSKQESC